MNTTFLAGVLDDDPVPGFGRMSSSLRDHLILLGALLFVISAVVIWAYFFRKKRHRSGHRKDRRLPRRSLALDAARGVAEISRFVKERQEGRRRHHRPRNPTLAETGGLPPIRKDAQSPPDPRP